MDQKKVSAWKNIRNLGTVSLIVGSLWAVSFVVSVVYIIYRLGFEPELFLNFLLYFGVVFIPYVLITIVLIILHIIAGIKLRKPISKPKWWIITLIVLGGVSALSFMGILTLVFGIIALNSYKDIEGDQSTPSEIPIAK